MIQVKENGMIDAEELHKLSEVKSRFRTWVQRVIKNCDLEEGIDFRTKLCQNSKSPGRPRKKYEFTKDAAKEVCIVSATPKAKKIRRYLIELDRQRESKDLLTHDEVIMLNKLKAFFIYVENQKQIYHKHKDAYAANHNDSKNPYAEFNIWRNKILQIDKHELDRQIQKYCVENSRRLPRVKSNHEKILFLDEYNALRNAVWDFLKIQGTVDAEKLSDLVRRMAESENLTTYRKNETNLFREKESIGLPKIKNT
jgi:anti-repressor protein